MAAGLVCGERLFHRKRNARTQSIAETGACRFGAWLACYCRASPQNGQPRRQKFCLSETYYAPMGIRHFRRENVTEMGTMAVTELVSLAASTYCNVYSYETGEHAVRGVSLWPPIHGVPRGHSYAASIFC